MNLIKTYLRLKHFSGVGGIISLKCVSIEFAIPNPSMICVYMSEIGNLQWLFCSSKNVIQC